MYTMYTMDNMELMNASWMKGYIPRSVLIHRGYKVKEAALIECDRGTPEDGRRTYKRSISLRIST